MIKIGKKCNWKDIEIGEVFAFKGCISIFYKSSNTTAIFLDSTDDWADHKETFFGRGENLKYKYIGGFGSGWDAENLFWNIRIPFGCMTENAEDFTDSYLYKLPKSTQKLWKEE